MPTQMCNRRASKWAQHFTPGLHTLGMASTQRVEGVNSALKKLVNRRGDMVDLNRAILGKVQDDAINTKKVGLRGMDVLRDFAQKLASAFTRQGISGRSFVASEW